MKPGKVYFVECAGRVKIGFSTDVNARLRQLSTGSALTFNFISAVDGSKSFERAIHKALAEHRSHGEWFHDTPQVRSIINAIIADGYSAINFIEPAPVERGAIEHEMPAANFGPSFMHSIVVRIEACAERYFGAASGYTHQARAERSSLGFPLIHDAVNATESLVGKGREDAAVLGDAATIVSQLEAALEALFSTAPLAEVTS